MKRLRLILALAFPILAGCEQKVVLPSSVGRYQMVSGPATSNEDKTGRIIKIDTTNGDTWELVDAKLQSGKSIGSVTAWVRISEDLSEEMDKMQVGLKKMEEARLAEAQRQTTFDTSTAVLDADQTVRTPVRTPVLKR